MKLGKRTAVAKEITRQERNRRNNIKRLTISALVALILFICLTIIQSSILNQESKQSVYQVIADIESGTKITEDNFGQYFAVKEVQASLIPDEYITDKSSIVGKFVNRSYKAKDIVTEDGLTDTERLYLESITNPTEISFTASSLDSSVAGTVREGDYVNIYGITEDSEESIYVASKKYTFKHVYIFKAFDGSGNRNVTASNDDTLNTSSTTTSMYTVVLAEDDVELFNEMLLNCSIRMAKIKYDTDTDYRDFISKTNETAGKSSVNTTNSYNSNGYNNYNYSYNMDYTYSVDDTNSNSVEYSSVTDDTNSNEQSSEQSSEITSSSSDENTSEENNASESEVNSEDSNSQSDSELESSEVTESSTENVDTTALNVTEVAPIENTNTVETPVPEQVVTE
jgi:hypothetical protein